MSNVHSSYHSAPPAPAMVYFFIKKFGPTLVHFGYFVASLRTFRGTFTGLGEVQKMTDMWYANCQCQ